MFEISIFCIVMLAAAYWTVLWFMGRRGDVLHGQFVGRGLDIQDPLQSLLQAIERDLSESAKVNSTRV
jgi:hypothetical protein